VIPARLAAAGCLAPEEEARLLAASAPDEGVLESWVRRRERGEPLAWVTGTTTFCGRRLRVDPGVYVPRAQSEELARRALSLLPRHGQAVDLCTGSGAIAACLAGSAGVVGVDIDPRAVACARANGVAAVLADVADLPLPARAFDLVTAVAPYVPTPSLGLLPSDVQRYEPRRALDGGHDGLDVVRLVLAAAARLLRPGGWALLELGGDQDQALSLPGFDAVRRWSDEDGYLRGLAARSAG